MDLITALAISIGVLGGLATFVFLSPMGLGLSIWAAFIAWGSFYHCGGKTAGLQTSVLGNLWGALWGALTLAAVTKTGLADSLGLPMWAGICVAVGVALMILGSKLPNLSSIPAAVYGYASVIALSLLTNAAGNVTLAGWENPALNIAISMVIGGVLGLVSEHVAGLLTASKARA
ncbi:MAG: DUF1097 domain-containing protein [Hyphomicrobium sp.]